MKAACRASCRPVSSANTGTLDASGKFVYVYNFSSALLEGFWLVPLPLSGRVYGVWFEIPLPIQAARNIIGGQGMLIDLKGNVYVALRAQIKGDPVSVLLLSYDSTGSLRWQTYATRNAQATQLLAQPVLTDDESLLLFAAADFSTGAWYFRAFDAKGGALVWNVSTQPWHDLSQCGTEITPLANHTVLLVCSSSNATYSLALVGFDQRTGVAFPGRVSLPGDTTFYSFDSSNNLFACWANNEGKGTVCAKQLLAPCLYTDTGCTIA